MNKMLIFSTVALLATPAFSQTLSTEGCRSDLFCPVIGEQSGEVLYLTRPTGFMQERHETFRTGSIPAQDGDDGSSSGGDDGEGEGEEGHAGGHGNGNGNGNGNGKGCGGVKGGGHGSDQGDGGGGGSVSDQALEPEGSKTCGPKEQDSKGAVLEGPVLVGG